MSQKTYQRPTLFLFMSTFLPELKVYDHGLSPLPVQNPYSKLMFGIKSLFVDRFSNISTNLVQNIADKIVDKIVYLPPNRI